MDGFESTRIVRATEARHRLVPIIVMTANAIDGDRELCLSVGMNDDLSKPVKTADLVSALGRWLPLSADDSPSELPFQVAGPSGVHRSA